MMIYKKKYFIKILLSKIKALQKLIKKFKKRKH